MGINVKGPLSKFKILNRDRYNGRGRPKESDYDWKSLVDLQREYNDTLNKMVDAVFISNGK